MAATQDSVGQNRPDLKRPMKVISKKMGQSSTISNGGQQHACNDHSSSDFNVGTDVLIETQHRVK
jgi:hypothetical protein